MGILTFTIRAITVVALIPLPCLPASAQRGLGLEGPASEKRVALVIGNSNYVNGPLKNPANDARDMARVLAQLDFEVIHKENLNQNEMKRTVRAFGEKIRGGGVGLFYYAGHGIQVNGENYLIPVDAAVSSEHEVEYESVNVGLVLAQMANAGNRLNIVILDACRNNPFARSFRSASGGLASIDAPSGTLIAYATAPGSVASDGNTNNGAYTLELLNHMRTPGLGVEEIFKRVRVAVKEKTKGKQIPWESSSLTGDFYFVAGDKDTTSTIARNSAASVDPVLIELSFWDSIKNSADPEDFRAYLKRYPEGRFTELATRRAQPATASGPSPGDVAADDKTPGYDRLINEAVQAMESNNGARAASLLRQAVTLDPSLPRAHAMLGFVLLYGGGTIRDAEQPMRAALERGGQVLFHVYHDDSSGTFERYCEGVFLVRKEGVSFKANNGSDAFEVEDSTIKEVKLNSFVGSELGAFHIKLTKEAGGRNYNFAPSTRQKTESQLIINLIEAYR